MNKDRRNILLGLSASPATVTSNSTFASLDPSHHNMHKHSSLVDSALDCLKAVQSCNDHCIELVKSGDTSIADCMSTVSEMLAACTALSQLALYQSTHLVAMAKVCIDVCEDCENECKKHEAKHAECKACADACRDCIKACKKVAA